MKGSGSSNTLLMQNDFLRSVSEAIQAKFDPIGMATPLINAQLAWLSHPQELSNSVAEFSRDMTNMLRYSWQRSLGIRKEGLVKQHEDDTRFADPIWMESATCAIAKEYYLLCTHHLQNMLYESPGLSGKECRRAAFWWRNWLNAVSPTNFLLTNPIAIKKAFETNGESLLKGMKIFLSDLEYGNVRMSDTSQFTVGQNLGTTAGKVVFRNRLLEVIHYTPTTEKVHEVPIVIVMPWINKHYILDLTPKKSMVKYLLDQGFDVYITCWKNPGEDMADVTFDDHISEGIVKLIDTAKAISGSDKVQAVGYCIGGTALTVYMAWANRHYPAGKVPVISATVFTTLLDTNKPGDIEVFLDEKSFEWISRKIDAKGFLDGNELGSAFRLLRSNSLIWHYVVHSYLYGENTPAFDVLYWNMDTTRQPAATHKWFLREVYLNNNLIKKDALTVAGEKIDLQRIVQPYYVVSTEDDHITPWRSTFRISDLVSGPIRFVLSNSGHILGIVNPVVNPPKREYWIATPGRQDTAESWHKRSEHRIGSWWPDWIEWLKPQAGKLVKAGSVSTKSYPALADAPGTYVMER